MRDLGPGKIMGGNVGNPNWREDLVASIEAKRKTSGNPRANPDSPAMSGVLRIVSRYAWADLVHEAAARHGISMSSYARRALSVHVAADMDLLVRDVLALCPSLTPPKYAQRATGMRRGGTVDDGEGIEKWCPHPGCDGAHLR